MLRAPHQERLPASLLDDQRRAVPVVVLGRSLVIARDLPAQLASRFVERRHPRFAVVHPDHDHVILGKHRRRAVVPVQCVRPETLNQVGLPAHLTVEFHRRQDAALEIDEDAFAIRRGRRIAARTIAMRAGFLPAKGRLPKQLS